MKDIRDYIVVVKDVLPESVCNSILEEYKTSSEWRDSYTLGGVNRNIRSATTILISTQEVLGVNPEVRSKIDGLIFESASIALHKYREKFVWSAAEKDTGYELLRYQKGEFYTEHVDASPLIPRILSCSFSINDDYKGGEFAFFGGAVKIRAPKGSAVMFPSNFMYPHQILPVTEGVRYSIITWFV